jgi:hypothetical protein
MGTDEKRDQEPGKPAVAIKKGGDCWCIRTAQLAIYSSRSYSVKMRLPLPDPPAPENPSKWGVLAAYLIEIERRSSELPGGQSMTSWINAYAEKSKRKASTLWRLLGAGKYYRELREELLESSGISLPELTDSALVATPESLELLNKTSRVAPTEIGELKLAVMQGRVSRRQLRDTWTTFRPVLQGRTARGRDVTAPSYNSGNEGMRIAREKADVLNCIRKAGSGWIPKEDSGWVSNGEAYIYKVIPTKGVPELDRIHDPFPDAFVIYSADTGSPVLIYSIVVLTSDDQMLRAGQIPSAQMDGLWIAANRDLVSAATHSEVSNLGVLLVKDEQVEVLRHVGTAKEWGSAGERAIRGLMTIAMRPE